MPRLYLRRFLVPSFNLTFSKRDSVELSVDEFRELLTSPKAFREKKRMRGAAEGEKAGGKAPGAAGSTGQLSLVGFDPPKRSIGED